MRKSVTFEGYKVRPSYEELINTLDKPLDLKYPDRKASQMRNSHWLSQLDGDSFRAMDELHHSILKGHEKEALLKGYASSHSVSLASVRSHHIAPSEHGATAAPSEYSAPAVLPEYFQTYTPPPSPRHHQPQQQQTEVLPEVLPEVQQHYQQVPEAPRQSKNIKVKSKIEKSESKKESRFKQMHDEDYDEKVKDQHEMNLDDAEMQQQRASLKKEFKDLLPNLDDNQIDKIVKKHRTYVQGVKRSSDPSSSSTQPISKVKTKRGKGEKRDAESESIPMPKAKAKANPVNNDPESIHPKQRGRPPNRPTSSDDEVEIQGVVLNKAKAQSYWKKQSPNEIRAQLVLRDIPRSKTGFATKAELLGLIKELVKNNKW